MQSVYRHKNKKGFRNLRYLTVLFLFVTLHVLGSVEEDRRSEYDTVANDAFDSFLHPSDQNTDFSNKSLSLPMDTIPVSGQEKETDTKENLEEDDWTGSQSLITISRCSLNNGIAGLNSVHFLESQAHHSQQALFILYCSWKSYLRI